MNKITRFLLEKEMEKNTEAIEKLQIELGEVTVNNPKLVQIESLIKSNEAMQKVLSKEERTCETR